MLIIEWDFHPGFSNGWTLRPAARLSKSLGLDTKSFLRERNGACFHVFAEVSNFSLDTRTCR
jgi:hypothetical protein